MKLSLITGLLAPALLSVAAASQTIVVVRPLPFTGVPRILPAPLAGLPLTPARLPSPLPMPKPAASAHGAHNHQCAHFSYRRADQRRVAALDHILETPEVREAQWVGRA